MSNAPTSPSRFQTQRKALGKRWRIDIQPVLQILGLWVGIWLGELLHPSFIEFGRSGQRYTKADMLRDLPLAQPSAAIWAQNFAVVEIADGVALLTHQSAHVDENGELSRHTLRSSLWQRAESGWQMRFHQGTPTDAFAKIAP